MLMDVLAHGTSAVYSFFDPALEKRSLGTEMIVQLVEETRRLSRDYVYLGYWIKNCKKMAYKSRFPALQRLGTDGWEDFVTEE
jgi:leucyl-tRNA---protein transferase